MANTLLQRLQQKSGYEEIKKIDPNTEEAKTKSNEFNRDRFAQAAIPSVLIALYKFTRSDEGAAMVLNGSPNDSWMNTIFGATHSQVLNKVATYSSDSTEKTSEEMENIAHEAVQDVRNQNPAGADDVKKILANEKNDMLLYLPPSLQIGESLNDNTLDDHTNKMEGPVSSIMNAIGGIFSATDDAKVDD